MTCRLSSVFPPPPVCHGDRDIEHPIPLSLSLSLKALIDSCVCIFRVPVLDAYDTLDNNYIANLAVSGFLVLFFHSELKVDFLFDPFVYKSFQGGLPLTVAW